MFQPEQSNTGNKTNGKSDIEYPAGQGGFIVGSAKFRRIKDIFAVAKLAIDADGPIILDHGGAFRGAEMGQHVMHPRF